MRKKILFSQDLREYDQRRIELETQMEEANMRVQESRINRDAAVNEKRRMEEELAECKRQLEPITWDVARFFWTVYCVFFHLVLLGLSQTFVECGAARHWGFGSGDSPAPGQSECRLRGNRATRPRPSGEESNHWWTGPAESFEGTNSGTMWQVAIFFQSKFIFRLHFAVFIIIQLSDRSIDWLIRYFCFDQSIESWIVWSIGRLIDWLSDQLFHRLIVWLFHRLIDWLIVWRSIDWLIGPLIHWLIDYLLYNSAVPSLFSGFAQREGTALHHGGGARCGLVVSHVFAGGWEGPAGDYGWIQTAKCRSACVGLRSGNRENISGTHFFLFPSSFRDQFSWLCLEISGVSFPGNGTRFQRRTYFFLLCIKQTYKLIPLVGRSALAPQPHLHSSHPTIPQR